jgi:cytochrome P450
MTDIEQADFFTDAAVTSDPYPYFDALRTRCPVHPVAHPSVVAVTGYDEAMTVYRDSHAFSSCNAIAGPFPTLPVEPGNDDITDMIEQNRRSFPLSDDIITMDGDVHDAERMLLRQIMTPRGLKDNEADLAAIADRCIDSFLDKGVCDVISEYAKPFSTLVIADMLGMPDDDCEEIRAVLLDRDDVGVVGTEEGLHANPLEVMFHKFKSYVEDRRSNPRHDVLTHLATTTYSDGTMPDVDAIVRHAAFLFGAGQDTTARMIGAALRIVAENPALQDLLRAERDRIPNFIEEVLRLESPVMSDFRLTRHSTSIAGVQIPAGTTVMLHPGAANRDPRRFDDPDEFRLGRENGREHMAFGRGQHTCPGSALARAEGRVTMERFLDRTTDIAISESHHGPTGDRRYNYDATYILRGLSDLHITLTPAARSQDATAMRSGLAAAGDAK